MSRRTGACGALAAGVILSMIGVVSAGCSGKTTVKVDGERVDFDVHTHPG